MDLINITDRRSRRTNEKLLSQLCVSIKGVQEAWSSYVQEENDSIDSLLNILITINFLKETCFNKKMTRFFKMFEESENFLTDLTENPQNSELRIKSQAHLKIIEKELNDFNQEYIDNKFLTDIADLDDDNLQVAVALPASKKVFIISREEKFTDECSLQISYYGYETIVFGSFENFIVGLSQDTPVAIIADLDLFQDDSPKIHSLKDYCSQNQHIPMIMISNNGDFQARLDSVQAGSIGFFVKPVNISLLLDKLDSVISSALIMEAPRVLVIDDSKTVSSFLAKTLIKAGMIVHVENSPENALGAIPQFNPDLILMDIYMPICDGEDLCRIIRQSEFFTSIPIVFLSSETDIKKQLNAMKIGADDFLTKDINTQHLISSITTRIHRHRILSSFMVRDSLTGLYNHTASKKQLEQMIAKANIMKTSVVFAMIDIDKFKKVNDTYGHPAGDRVIKSLSRLLQKRLRKTDSLGRYGGEEFAVVLWDIEIEQAEKIMNQLREDFSMIEHVNGADTFQTTFSVGLAASPPYKDAVNISLAADRALYRAKNSGRNMVCIAKD